MRKKIIAGNWKMNIKPSETAALVKGVVEATKDFTNVEVVCCTPAIDVPAAVAAAAGTHVGVGAENCHWKESGAYTGEISTGMLLDAGAKYVIIGHSERRQYFGETDETVNLRARAAIAAGLTAIVCVGETLEERDAGKLEEVIVRQMNVGLKDVTAADCAKLVGAETAETVRIQYGGSMKPGNAAELLAKKDIDGGLIGGAALKAADFAGIVAAANA